MADAKAAARSNIESGGDRLVDLSHRIHANPELAFDEHQASRWVADELERAGYQVERGVADLPTALVASVGSGPLVLGICCEYDALPDVGHACGHNVIAAAGVGAAVGLADIADDLGITVKVYGTPAEEGGGGKVLMIDRGLFDGTHATMMVHPSPHERVDPQMLAIATLGVTYTGKAAHASAYPHQGVNAADALTVAQVSVGLLRQHLRLTDRVHGITTRGGEAPNIVPVRTAASYYVRALDMEALDELLPRVRACFEAGATATGAALDIDEPTPPYAEMRNDGPMMALYKANAEAAGREFPAELSPTAAAAVGSSDIGNVSRIMPTIHPMLGIECGDSGNHQPEFARHCAEPSADAAVVQSAMAMAWTCVDLATDDDQRARLAG